VICLKGSGWHPDSTESQPPDIQKLFTIESTQKVQSDFFRRKIVFSFKKLHSTNLYHFLTVCKNTLEEQRGKLMKTQAQQGSRRERASLHALTELRKSAGLFLVASLSKPALNAAYIPVQLLGEALQPLLIWMLRNREGLKRFLCPTAVTPL